MDNFIAKLPDDIIRYIYKEFIEIEYHTKIIKELLNTRESIKLNIINIRPYIPFILSKPELCNYLCNNLILHNNYKYFEETYKYYKKNNNKHFSQMTKGDSFALTLLMKLYH